ncbi:MAG: CxxC-x17-CxxC domain-containing protein [Candidatus Omnitrophota bacterium]
MKKNIKPKSSSIPHQDEQDMAALINKMQEQLVSLEKKIDILISRPSEKPSEEKPFSKPFQRFDRSHHHGKGERDNNFRERNFTQVICSDCNKECEVPFKPSGDRPVYCKECFAKRKDRGPHKENYDNKPREQVFTPERHFDKRKNSENRKPVKRKQSGFRRRKE